MQTFLPFKNFRKSARHLDRARLGKQRVECYQILNTIYRNNGPWVNHPAVLMWKDYEYYLQQYYNAVVMEWISRGYKHHMALPYHLKEIIFDRTSQPWWINEPALYESHRANLIKKNPEYYGKLQCRYGDQCMPYYWPVTKQGTQTSAEFYTKIGMPVFKAYSELDDFFNVPF